MACRRCRSGSTAVQRGVPVVSKPFVSKPKA